MLPALPLALFQNAPATPAALVCADRTAAPGKPFLVALHLRTAPGWHTYYVNPGQSGMPTSIRWHLPPGFAAGPILWPAPRRVAEAGITNLVYGGDLWLFTKITPPRSARPGTRFLVRAKAEWLLCSSICVPQRASLSVAETIGRRAVPAGGAVRAALRSIPKPKPPFSLVARRGPGGAVLFAADGNERRPVQFYPADADAFGAAAPKFESSARGFLLVLGLSQFAHGFPKRVSGVLTIGPDAYRVDVPLR